MRTLLRPSSGRRAFRLLPTTRPYSTPSNKFLVISEEVRAALAEKRPVVALESAVYTHGFPVPENLELAHAMEDAVRQHGAVPATITIMNGKAHVGLTKAQTEEMAAAAGKPGTVKVSRRDLPFVTGVPYTNPGVKFVGGTTIAGTSILAHMAGIKVFATGGLGGVHRGVERTMDVSADLTELGRTNVAVISSGSKAFLDLPKTLEYLETEGVYVGTFGKRDSPEPVQLPAFYSRGCGLLSPSVIESAEEAAGIIYASHNMGLKSGQLLCNPIPEEYEIPHEQISQIIADAVKAAEGKASGKDVTPYILADILKRTGGKSIHCNRALLVNNAAMGGRVAAALAKLEGYTSRVTSMPHIPAGRAPPSTPPASPAPTAPSASQPTTPTTTTTTSSSAANDAEVVVIGALALDTTITPNKGLHLHTSNPSRITSTPGGVAHNLHKALTLSGAHSHLITAVGTDPTAATLSSLLVGGHTLIPSSTHPSAQYISFNTPDGGLHVAGADMDIIAETLTAPALLPLLPKTVPYVLVDGNLKAETLHRVITYTQKTGQKLIFEPTSTAKSTRILPMADETADLPLLHTIAPNLLELKTIWEAAKEKGWFDLPSWFSLIDDLRLGPDFRDGVSRLGLPQEVRDAGAVQMAVQLLPLVENVAVKLGADGVLVVRMLREKEQVGKKEGVVWWGEGRGVQVGYWKAEKVEKVVSVNGAGDTFLGVWVAGEVKGKGVGERVRVAQRAAARTVGGVESVANLEGIWEEEGY